MSKKFWITVLVCLQIFCSPVSFAQQSEMPPPSGTRKQMATIIYSGLAGFILGLSTLSFYGRPQDKLGNLGYGFGIGIIVGAISVTYNATSDPDKFYGREARLDWPQIPSTGTTFAQTRDPEPFVPLFSYSTSF